MNSLNNVAKNQAQFFDPALYHTQYNVFANQIRKEFPWFNPVVHRTLELMFLDHMNDLKGFKECVTREIHEQKNVQLRIIDIATEILLSKFTQEKKGSLTLDFDKIEDFIEIVNLESEAEIVEFFKNLHSTIISGSEKSIRQIFPNERSVFLLLAMLKNPNPKHAELAFNCLNELVKSEQYSHYFCKNQHVDAYIALIDVQTDAAMIKNMFLLLETIRQNSSTKFPEVHNYITSNIFFKLTTYLQDPNNTRKSGSIAGLACLPIEKMETTEALRTGLYWQLGNVVQVAPLCEEFLRQGGLAKVLSLLDAHIAIYSMSTANGQQELEKTILFADRILNNVLTNPKNCINLPLESLLKPLFFQLNHGTVKIKVWTICFFGTQFPKFKPEVQLLLGEQIGPRLIDLLNQDFSFSCVKPTDENNELIKTWKAEKARLIEAAAWSLHKFAQNPKVIPLLLKNDILNILTFQFLRDAELNSLKNILLCLGALLPDNSLDLQAKELPLQSQEIYSKMMDCLNHHNDNILLHASRAFNSLVTGSRTALPKEYALKAIPELVKLTRNPNNLIVEAAFWNLGNFILKGFKEESVVKELMDYIQKNIFHDANQDPKVVEAATFCYLNIFEKETLSLQPYSSSFGLLSDQELKNQIDLFLSILLTSPHAKVQEGILWQLHKLSAKNPAGARYFTQKGFDIVADLLTHSDIKIASGALWCFGKMVLEYKNVYGTFNTSVIESAIESLLFLLHNNNEKLRLLAVRCLGTLSVSDTSFFSARKIQESNGIALLNKILKEETSDEIIESLIWTLASLNSKDVTNVIVESLGEEFISKLIDKNIPKISEAILIIFRSSKDVPEWAKMSVKRIYELQSRRLPEFLNQNIMSEALSSIKLLNNYITISDKKFENNSALVKSLCAVLVKDLTEMKYEAAKLLMILMLKEEEQLDVDPGMVIHKNCTPLVTFSALEHLSTFLEWNEALIPTELLMNLGMMSIVIEHAKQSRVAQWILIAAKNRSEAIGYWAKHSTESDLHAKIFESLMVNTREGFVDKIFTKFMTQLSKEIPTLDKSIQEAIGLMFLDNNLANFTLCVKREIQSVELQDAIIAIASNICIKLNK